MSKIHFKTTLSKHHKEIGSPVLITLPKSASAKLPSRGMTLIEGTINNFPLRAVIEPDGKESHWFKVDKAILKTIKADGGDTVTLAIEPSSNWPEPKLPADVRKALATNPTANTIWIDITPMARWDWIRWIGSTKYIETRKRRIETTCAMLKAGKRRPCCFNRKQCTLTDA